MTKPGDESKEMRIKIKTQKLEDPKIKDEQQRKATVLSPEESEEIYNDKNTHHIGEVLYRHSSPG